MGCWLESDIGRIRRGDGVLRVGADDDFGSGRVVAISLAGASRCDRKQPLRKSGVRADFPQLLERDSACAQNYRHPGRAIEDGRFETDLALFSSQDAPDSS